MKKLFLLGAAAMLLAAGSASATTLADFQLNGSTANAAGGAVTLTNNAGGVLGANGITFAANGGPTVSGLGTLDAYTLEIGFSIDNTNGYRKLVDYSNGTLDSGLYNYNGVFRLYPLGSGGVTITPGTQLTLKVVRDASQLFTVYANDTEQFHLTDSGNLTRINSVLKLFQDDSATSGEASSGFVDFVRIADGGGFTEVGGGGAVPEPATWALMIGGFGGAGAMLRRRRASAAA